MRISRIRLSDRLHRKAHGGRPIRAGVSRRHRGTYTPSPCDRACSDASESQRCCQAHRQSPTLCIFPSMPEVRVLCSAGITRHQRSYDPVRLPPGLPCLPRHRSCDLRPKRVSPDYPHHLSDVPCPLPRRIERVLMSITSPLMQPSPNGRRVGIRIVTFEACSGFTRITARRIAQPPKATPRLREGRLLSRGFSPASYPTKPLVSYRIYRQLSVWNPPPLVIRAFGAHCQQLTLVAPHMKPQCAILLCRLQELSTASRLTGDQYRAVLAASA